MGCSNSAFLHIEGVQRGVRREGASGWWGRAIPSERYLGAFCPIHHPNIGPPARSNNTGPAPQCGSLQTMSDHQFLSREGKPAR